MSSQESVIADVKRAKLQSALEKARASVTKAEAALAAHDAAVASGTYGCGRDGVARAVTNPHVLLEQYGAFQLPEVLRRFGLRDLEMTAAILRAEHPGTRPAGRKKAAYIDYIVQQVTK